MNNQLLVEIQRFAVSSSIYHRDEPPESKKIEKTSKILELKLMLFSSFSNTNAGEEKLEASRGATSYA
jgi:hypothetical protein